MRIDHLTAEQKREQVAVFMGWKREQVEDGLTFSEPKRPAYRTMWVRDGDKNTKTIKLPNFCEDLNACAEFEALLSNKIPLRKHPQAKPVSQRDQYLLVLESLVFGRNRPDMHVSFETVTAGPELRVDALLTILPEPEANT